MENEPPLPLMWEGTQFAHHSFSHVNRELSLALLRRPELALALMPFERDQFDPTTVPRFAPLVRALVRNQPTWSQAAAGRGRVWVRHQFPPRNIRPPQSAWVIYHPWEYSLVPESKLRVLERADEIWTPSRFSQQSLSRSGFPEEKIRVVPNGVNLEIFRPHGPRVELPDAKPFRFLFVGGTIYRKGVDILLKAYGRAFTSADPVTLVIKDFGTDQIYRGQTGEDWIREFAKNPAHPEILYFSDYRSENELAALYRACDVFVSSYRAEGFCLPVLEAMACGRPVIVTQGGGTDDFVLPLTGWQIPAQTGSVGTTVIGQSVAGEAHLLEPDIDALIHLLRKAFSDKGSRVEKGLAAAEAALGWSWDHAAAKVVNRCQHLVRNRETKAVAI